MAEQLTLDDLRAQYLTPAGKVRKPLSKKATPMPPGTGPADQSCGSCGNCCRTEPRSGRAYFKCWLVPMTSGPGTDIRKKTPACALWTPQQPGPGLGAAHIRVGNVTVHTEREWRGRGQSRHLVVVSETRLQRVAWRCPSCWTPLSRHRAPEQVEAEVERLKTDGRCEWCRSKETEG